ncbi:MAG TPA: hypothetical protein VFP59_05305 [Candidatus Angelobacter sp.]|nr:hypothetical protein [Candidatus Angelobacter sp.]
MQDFWEFLQAVFWHWQSWLGGTGFGGAVVVFVALWERFTSRVMRKRMYAAIFIASFLFGAFFLAWRDQYHAAREAQRHLNEVGAVRVPKLEGSIMFLSIAPARDPSDSVVGIFATIDNTGAPSIAKDFRAYLQKPGESRKEGIAIDLPMDQLVFVDSGGHRKIVKTSEYLPKKAIEQPIPTGGSVPGFMLMLFRGITPKEVESPTVDVIFEFKDVTGKPYEVHKHLNGDQQQTIPFEDVGTTKPPTTQK